MKFRSTTKVSTNNRFWAVLIIFGVSLLFIRLMSVESVVEAQGERELDAPVPQHLPITIKIKSETDKAFKDLNNEHWARDFELEVRNTGDKPIYFLLLIFELPEVKVAYGNEYGFSLRYGRSELVETTASPNADDIPIKPGETYLLKIPKHQVEGWEDFSRREQPLPIKKVQILFNFLSFGDGTGFLGTGGEAFDKNKGKGSNGYRSVLSRKSITCRS